MESSLKRYESCFKKTSNFWAENKPNPFLGAISDVPSFSTLLLDNEAAHISINAHRLDISSLVGPEMFTDPGALRLFQGIFNLRLRLRDY